MTARSMTGFARVRETIAGIDVTLSIKAVNHRGLDIHFYTGAELDPFEQAMRSAIKRHVGRGHLDVRFQLAHAGASAGVAGVDLSRLDAYVAAFRTAAERYGVDAVPDLNAALRVPGVLSDSAGVELPESFEVPLVSLLEEGLRMLNQFREREGGEIAALIAGRARVIDEVAGQIEILRESAMPAYQARLCDRLSVLLSGTQIDAQRIMQEAALLADRSDIGEEVERLRIHARQADALLADGSEIGKKLDFLLQEMNRETNTILSKTSGLGESGLRITELAVAAKSDIEKMREQSLNLE